jgi:LacI family transcriptional regulator
LGYSLQHIRVKTNAPESPQLTQILNTLGIRGLILAPFEHHLDTIDLEFDNFSIVTIEKPTLYPNFQYITQNHFSNVLLCWEKLRERNYTSVGLVVMTDLADRWHHHWEAAHNYALSQINPSPKPIPILKLNSGSEIDSVRHWIREHKPQVVISRCDQFFVAAKQENLRIPEDIGYVSLNISDDHPEASGINQNRKAIGSIAIDALNGLLLGNQRGERTVATGTLVEGTWHEGDTLPSRG